MMNLVPDINLSKEGPLVQATANIGRESRRRMRVENVDFPGHRQKMVNTRRVEEVGR